MKPELYTAFESTFTTTPPHPKRVPFRWKALPIGSGEHALHLKFPASGPDFDQLRITYGLDERELKSMEIRLADSGKVLFNGPIRFPFYLQMDEFPVAPEDREALRKEGVVLELTSPTGPLWIFGGEPAVEPGREFMQPHLLPVDGWRSDPWEEAFDRLASATSLQPYGWLEGCPLEGLQTAARRRPAVRGTAVQAALDLHLQKYFPADHLICEDPKSKPFDDRVGGLESMIMMASLARWRPDHPAIGWARDMWMPLVHQEDRFYGGERATCEGCLTAAYPMAVLGRVCGEPGLLDLAAYQLKARQKLLVDPVGIWLRSSRIKEERTYPNWMRGVAWFIWGHALTIRELRLAGVNTGSIEAGLHPVISRILSLQSPDGLWTCFGHQPETGPETSGASGFCLGLLELRDLGIVGDEVVEVSRKCLDGLTPYLTRDGFLHGVAPSNKKEGGEAMQRSGYRMMSQMGLGMAVGLREYLVSLG